MAFSPYLHGIEVSEEVSGSLPIQTIRTAVIGLIGTSQKGTANKVQLITSPRDAEEAFGSLSSIRKAIESKEDEARKKEASISKETNAAEIEKLKNDLATINDEIRAATADLANPKLFTLEKAFEAIYLQGSPLIVAISVGTGFSESMDEVVNAIVGSASDQSGVYAFLSAQSEVGFTPKILLAPAFADDVGIQAALLSVAVNLRAIALFETPEAATFQNAIALSESTSSSRAYLSFPWVEGVGDIGTVPMSAFIAGTIARNDLENGFWASPSNKVMNGIKALKSKVSWSLSDPNSQANLLNEKGVATAIREGGFRLWGARSLGKNSKLDSANVFVNVRRTTDTINDSIVKASLWAVDKGITVNYVQDVLEAINNFLRNLRSQGAIINGLAFVDPKDNAPDQVKQGKVVFSFDYTAVYPAEQLKFKSILTDKYLTEVFE
jgi:phage tail sheath protein FI